MLQAISFTNNLYPSGLCAFALPIWGKINFVEV